MRSTDKTGFDQLRMLECLSLAGRGAGYVSPNPLVGAVVVKNKKIVGRGYHKRFGGPHAEVYAIRQAGRQANGATLYVNLEPCCHYGKTPPCTDLVVKSGIGRVVIGMKDPNPVVNGKGIRILRSSGIKIDFGVLEDECHKLNESFLKYVTTGMPFVTLKIAQTLDGKIADARGTSRWITNENSQKIVHALRARNDAVLVGANTVVTDNPQLTVRMVRGRNPYRIILDGNLASPLGAKVFNDKERVRTMLFTSTRGAKLKERYLHRLSKNGVKVFVLQAEKRNSVNLRAVMKILAQENIASVMVEGGARTFAQFLDEGLADKCIIFIAPKLFRKGITVFQYAKRPGNFKPMFHNISSWNLEGDLMVEAYLQKNKKFI